MAGEAAKVAQHNVRSFGDDAEIMAAHARLCQEKGITGYKRIAALARMDLERTDGLESGLDWFREKGAADR